VKCWCRSTFRSRADPLVRGGPPGPPVEWFTEAGRGARRGPGGSALQIRLLRRNRGLIPVRAACQGNDRGQVRERDRCEAVGFSHGDFGLVVQTLDHATGNQFLSAE